MFAKRMLIAFTFAVLSAADASAVGTRYFLSMSGLSNPDDDQSSATAPSSLTTDPGFTFWPNGGPIRLYLWADLSPLGAVVTTDLMGIDLALSVTGGLIITRTNIWQRVLDDGDTPTDPADDLNRWASAPGLQSWSSQYVDLAPAVAVLETGLSTRSAVTNLDNQDRAGNLWLFGWLEVDGGGGEVQIHNNASGFLQGTGPTNTIYLGLDDFSGGPAEVPGQPVSYSNASWEAYDAVPEPATLALMTLAALALRRR